LEYAVVVRRLLLAVFTGLSAGVLVALAPACTGESGDPDAGQNPVGSGGAGKVDGGSGAGGAGGSSSTSDAGGAGQKSPVIVSVVANGLVAEGQSETLSDLVEAELVAYAAGARGAHLAWEWRDSDPQGPAGATEAAAFAAHGARARQLGREPILELLVVDALRDLKPSSVTGLAWDDALVVSGLLATIDAALVAYDGELRTILLGRDVNAYLEDHPLERDALTDLLEAGATYATSHPLAPAKLVVGVGLRAADVVSQPSVDKELLVAGTGAVFAYVPGYDGSVGTNDPAFVPADLDAMVALAAERPVVLLTGYPSAGETGSSEASQLAFYGALFEALELRREAFHAVSALRLYDVPEGVRTSTCTASSTGRARSRSTSIVRERPAGHAQRVPARSTT
jgi:surface antigen